MTHTPGPWGRNIKPARKYRVVYAGRNTHVASVEVQALTDEEIESNCDLIAAAPDLLEACRTAHANLKPAYCQDHLVMRRLSAAIAKAEGRRYEEA